MPFLPFFFLFLISCSDNLLYNEATPHIFIEILNHSDTILAGETVRFQAVISPSPEDVEFFWVIENENSPNYPTSSSDLLYEKKFRENGLYNVKFYAKDRFYDAYESNLLIRVSSAPVCDGLSLENFQGSPIFKWNCIDTDGDGSLIYKLSLLNKYGFLLPNTTLTENSLQLGYAIVPQKNDTIRLIATNKYGIETRLDSVWGLP